MVEATMNQGLATDGAHRRSSSSYYFGLNKHDDFDHAQKHINQGTLVAKNFAKHLPNTAHDLSSGKTTPEELVRLFGPACYLTRMVRVSSMGDDWPKKDVPFMDYLVEKLYTMAVPLSFCRDPRQTKWCSATASVQFKADLKKRITEHLSKSNHMHHSVYDDALLIPATLVALEETCLDWSQRMDENIFPKQSKGSFLFLCPMFGLEPNVFEEKFHSIMSDLDAALLHEARCETENKMLTLFCAASALVHGDHETYKTCWECDKPANFETLKHCSLCQVALYCCKGCQVTAWKSGHNKSCCTLKENNAMLVEASQTIIAAHDEKGSIRPCAELDYKMALWFVQNGNVYADDNDNTSEEEAAPCVPEGPTMKIFYSNLGRIVNGGWWLFEGTDSLEVYKSKLENHAIPDDFDEMACFEVLYFFLGFDYFAFFADESGNTNPADISSLLSRDDSRVSLYTSAFGLRMPRERFIELYQERMFLDEDSENNALRRNKTWLFRFLRDNCHKEQS